MENAKKFAAEIQKTVLSGQGDAGAKPLIEMHGIRKSYYLGQPNELEILHGIDLAVYPGEFVAIVGESGSGKSTLLNIIAGILRPTSGKAMVMGSDWAAMSDAKQCRMRCAHVGLVVQDFALIEQITVLENCLLAAVLNQQSRKAGLLRANELLETLGLTAFRKTKACYLSGGQRQRVAIARADEQARNPAGGRAYRRARFRHVDAGSPDAA